MVTPNENLHDGKSSGERIAKAIARSGLCSRREAEALIEDRRVSVNGAVIDSAALDILPTDKVLVDGKPLAAREPPRLWRYHKPKGRVTTHKDPEGRPTVFEALPENLPRLISVGRLDFNTEGLLLLTNDGDLARHLELPSTGWTRRYRVRAYGQVSEEQLKELADGITIDKMNYGPVEATLEREQGDNVWIAISIREGKNREVRRIMEHLGLTVNRLIRVSFGPFMLGELETGQIEEVRVAVLKDQLGPRLTRQLGVRREPLREERRLAPTRSKPSYLRRKPETGARPGWPGPADGGERPLKRRRIFDEGSAEAPKVEFVAEKPHFQKRGEGAGERAGERPERPPFRSRGAGERSGQKPRFQKAQTRARESARRGRRSVAVELARVRRNRVSRSATRVLAGVPRGRRSVAVELAKVRRNRVSRSATRVQASVPRGRRSVAVELARARGNRAFRSAARARASVPKGRHSAAVKPARVRVNRVSRSAARAQVSDPERPPFRSRGGDEGAGKPHFEKRGEAVGERAGRPPFRSRAGEHEGGDKPRFQRRGEGGAERAERPPFPRTRRPARACAALPRKTARRERRGARR